MADPRPGVSALKPYLRIQAIAVHVSDLDRSRTFYGDALGFGIIQPPSQPTDRRLLFVAPPDGAAVLVLVESDLANGRSGAPDVAFVTDDLDARYREWSQRGVHFAQPPRSVPWSARQAIFLDPDGNAFSLIEADVVSQQLDGERNAAAERQARERRAAQEIEIATQVQAGLFPRRRPPLATLDYEGVCLQARQVGGDYFDFLDFGGGRLGLVVGDVSGKGLGAALLMANLQAHLRGQFALYSNDIPGLLSSVNQLFQQSAPAAAYATLFFGAYDDRTRTLSFLSCGHPPPLLLRSDGRIESLDTTSGVIGMFEDWAGTARDITLEDGDLLALYSDGVIEARNAQDEEFGLERLADLLKACAMHASSASEVLSQAMGQVQRFAAEQPFDDMTMVIARCRPKDP
jgi:serine phosphatase RsbU (regulator of sigma subunit)/catechol 2,3-dioxygenase-like lactoylglutathione lyase family enzyme